MKVETVTMHARTITYYQDEYAQNPRIDFDNVGVFVDWHQRDQVGDRKVTTEEEAALRRGGFDLLRRYLRRFEGVAVLLPVSLLDHSGWHVWVGGGAHWSDAQGWDSGTVGFIYCTQAQVDEEWGGDKAKAETYLEGEIETLDQYFTGDVYGYVIEDIGGNHMDSCWGFFGFDFCKEQAEESVKNDEHRDCYGPLDEYFGQCVNALAGEEGHVT